MPDRMPEDMLDKMPEDMSERMPEDLPVTKRINVTVGITRSKVILTVFFVSNLHSCSVIYNHNPNSFSILIFILLFYILPLILFLRVALS